jgi:hypothetical protein
MTWAAGGQARQRPLRLDPPPPRMAASERQRSGQSVCTPSSRRDLNAGIRTMETTSVTLGIPVGNVAEAGRWYERLFDSKTRLEPVDGILELEVQDDFWLQLFEEDGGSGHAVLRFGVRDVEAARMRLTELDIEVGEVERVEGEIAFFDFVDPWGNALSYYEVLAT